jgi:hypothetical protein
LTKCPNQQPPSKARTACAHSDTLHHTVTF